MNIKGYEQQFNAFLIQNEIFWRENTGSPGDEQRCLFVDLAHDNAAYLLTNLWVAKYLQKLRGGRLVGLAQGWLKPCPSYDLDLIRKLADSFLVEEVIDLDAGAEDAAEVSERFRAAVDGLEGEALRKAILGFDAETDPDVGWILYDTWIRQEHQATIEHCEPELFECARSVFRARRTVSQVMCRRKVSGAVVGHYHYSPYAFMAIETARQNAPVYFQWVFVPVSIRKFESVADVRRGRARRFLNAYEEYFLKHIDAGKLQKWKRRMFDVQSGTREFLRVLEVNTEAQSRSDFLSKLRLDPKCPVVALYVPALCAAPHSSGSIAYDDFGDWLEQSLKIAEAMPTVNFIVKRHPQDGLYDRSGLVSQLERRYCNAANIRFLQSDISSAQMVEACDLIALMSGTPGYEMAVRGVPTLSAGASRYSGLGFTKEATNIETYRSLLAQAGEQKLSDEEGQRALCFAYFELAAGRAPSLFLPRFRAVGNADFWKEAELNLRSRYIQEDPLFRSIRYMVRENLPFLLNTDLLDAAEFRESNGDALSRGLYASVLSTIHALDRAVDRHRGHAQLVNALSQALEFSATLIRHGRSVQFGLGEAGNYLLGAGWSTPEFNGVWTDGYSAEILLPWVAGSAIVCLECHAYTPEFSPIRVVELYCNDVQLEEREFRAHQAHDIWTIRISSGASRLRLVLQIRQPATPPGDPRLLGIWLSRLWVRQD